MFTFKLPEFLFGFIIGISILCIILGVAFLPKISPASVESYTQKYFLELLIPYITGIIAGLGLGVGLKTEENGIGFSFGSDFGEQLPTLNGAISLAATFGMTVLLAFSGSPAPCLVLALVAGLLVAFGLFAMIIVWQGAAY